MEGERKIQNQVETLSAPIEGFNEKNINDFFEKKYEQISSLVGFAVCKVCGHSPLDENYYLTNFQNGLLRVVKELPTYDPKKSKLSASIVRWATWGMIDGLREDDFLSRETRKKVRDLSNDSLKQCKSDGEYNATFHALNPPVSLDALLENGDIIDEKSDLRPVEKDVDQKLILDLLSSFCEYQKNFEDGDRMVKILEMYLNGMTGNNIGNQIGISESRVNQILHDDIFPWFRWANRV